MDPISPAKFSNTSRRTIKSRKSSSIISSGKSSSSEGEEKETNAEKCSLLGEKKKKSCGRNSSNCLEKQETVPVPATRHLVKVEDHLYKDSSSQIATTNTNASSTLFVSNEHQNQSIINKLTREEKVRIRKLRRKLAGIGSTSSSERRSKQVGRKDLLEKSNNHNQQQQLKQHPHSSSSSSNLNSYRRRIGSGKRNNKNLFGFNKMFSKLSCVSCVEVLRECCGGEMILLKFCLIVNHYAHFMGTRACAKYRITDCHRNHALLSNFMLITSLVYNAFFMMENYCIL